MKLTKEQAIDYSIELWEWLAETGKQKCEWPKWIEFGRVEHHCFLCEYVGLDEKHFRRCKKCPLKLGDYGCDINEKSAYKKWWEAETEQAIKKYAKLFLEQLRSLK